MYDIQVEYKSALEELTEYRQWLAWEYVGNEKRPLAPHALEYVAASDAQCSYQDAYETAGARIERLGFFLTASDPYVVIDLDKCIVDGELMPWAWEIVRALNSYTEVSPSGTGLHVWVKGRKPGNRVSTGYETGKVEIFEQDRYVTFTGRQFDIKSEIEERQGALETLYNRLFPVAREKKGINTGVKGDGGFTGDEQKLLEKARNAGTGKLFTRLYDYGDASIYNYDHSKADMALCGMLAYWTGCDAERMDTLFRGSKLMRDKWDEVHYADGRTYGEGTIDRAIENCTNVYDPNYKTKAKDDVRSLLEGCTRYVLYGEWSGRSGGTDRDVYKALINTGLMHGKLTADGVVVSASVRTLAKKAGISSLKTVRDALKRLQENRGLIEKLEDGTSKRATTYLIRLTQDDHINNCVNSSVVNLSQTARIRNPSRYYTTIGKNATRVLDYVHAAGRVTTLEELAKWLKIRKNNLKARYVAKLTAAGFLIEVDGGYRTPADVEQRLERYLEESGMADAERLQAKKYELDRETWRTGSGRGPTERELEAMREKRQATKPVLIPSPPVNDAPAVERTCYLDADGIAQHTDPLCDDDCSVSFGHTQRVKELSAA